jgi:hypothetical protein
MAEKAAERLAAFQNPRTHDRIGRMRNHAFILFQTPVVPKKNSKAARIARSTGRAYLHMTNRARNSQAALHYEALAQLRKQGWKALEGWCRVDLVFAWNGRADTIGLAETVLDALQGQFGAYLDDKQVRSLELTMQPKGGELEAQGMTCEAYIQAYDPAHQIPHEAKH